MKNAAKIFAAACLLLIATCLQASGLPQDFRVPGGVAVLDVAPTSQSNPDLRFQQQPVLILSQQQRWMAVVGLPLSLTPGNYNLADKDGASVLQFSVADKAYPTQTLKVEPKYVEPPLEVQQRIARESALMREAFARFSEPLPSSLLMNKPAEGPETSAFGLRRVFNGQSRNPHSGLDIGAPINAEVVAPLAGKVVVTGDFYFNGNTVIVDHGGGLLSLFCHLNVINVREGQQLETGDLIGRVGATGRVTGPHLHFSVNLTGARVDPMLFFLKETGK